MGTRTAHRGKVARRSGVNIDTMAFAADGLRLLPRLSDFSGGFSTNYAEHVRVQFIKQARFRVLAGRDKGFAGHPGGAAVSQARDLLQRRRRNSMSRLKTMRFRRVLARHLSKCRSRTKQLTGESACCRCQWQSNRRAKVVGAEGTVVRTISLQGISRAVVLKQRGCSKKSEHRREGRLWHDLERAAVQ